MTDSNLQNENRYSLFFNNIIDYLVRLDIIKEGDVSGCSYAAITAMETKFGVKIPAVYREWLHIAGRQMPASFQSLQSYGGEQFVFANSSFGKYSERSLPFNRHQFCIITFLDESDAFEMLEISADNPAVSTFIPVSFFETAGQSFASHIRSIVMEEILNPGMMEGAYDALPEIWKLNYQYILKYYGYENYQEYEKTRKAFMKNMYEEENTAPSFMLPEELQMKWLQFLDQSPQAFFLQNLKLP